MKTFLKPVFRQCLPPPAYRALTEWWLRLTNGYARSSYAQQAEDLILSDLMGPRSPGFYVDIGAYHPIRFSNTWLFYRQGWRGLNLDARPGSMAGFRRLRPRDINLEIAISATAGTQTYYMFSEGAFNTFDAQLASTWAEKKRKTCTAVPVITRPLRDVLAEHLPPGQTVDFLTLDVERHEMDVLRSNDWARCRPEYILAECLDHAPEDLSSEPVVEYLRVQGYRPVAQTTKTVFFKRT